MHSDIYSIHEKNVQENMKFMKIPSHSLFLKTEWNHKIAVGASSAGFKCTFQLDKIHSPSVNPHIWLFIYMMTHCRVL